MAFFQRQHAHFGRKDESAVIHDIITGRTQAVSIQYGAHHIAVRVKNGSRAVPGLHHGCIILVEIAAFLGNGVVVGPGLRN